MLQLTATVIAGGLVAWLGPTPSSSQSEAALTARPLPREAAAAPAVTAKVHTTRAIAPAAAAVDTYFYDFENGTADWQIQPGFWSFTTLDGNHVARGAGNGFFRLMAHNGAISSFRFKFRLDDYFGSSLQATLMETWDTGVHRRYFVNFGTGGPVTITRQNGTMEELATAWYPLGPNVYYDVTILYGGGSIDVFVNGEGVVGVDDASPPPPGYVSFSAASSGNLPVFIDDVEVQIGAETAPHARAPRSPMALAPGADVGPFVNGAHTGTISLTGTDVLTLSKGRYTLTEGEIHLSGDARLRVDQGAVLIFDQGSSPLTHWPILLTDRAVLEIDGASVESVGGGSAVISAGGSSSVTIRNSKPWLQWVSGDGDATISILNSRIVSSAGTSVGVVGRASIDIQDSKVGSFSLVIPKGASFSATGLKPGTFADLDFRRDFVSSGIDFNLRLRNVELVPDTQGAGPLERGWVINHAEGASTHISDSRLRKLVVSLDPSGPDFAVSGLRTGTPTTRTIAGAVLDNVTVDGQWGFNVSGTRRATFDDCVDLWFFLYDTAYVLMRNSTMNEYDPRLHSGTFAMENSSWNGIGEIIQGNDQAFVTTGAVSFAVGEHVLSWSQSAVTRRFPIVVTDAAGKPVADAGITLTRGSEVVTATTGPTGEASVDLRFTDQNYTLPWQLTTTMGYAPRSVTFMTSAPVTAATPPSVTTHPGNQTVSAGATATFTVAANGSPAPACQWQMSIDSGTTWTNLTETAPYSGSATATLTVTSATVGLNGYQYRALATNNAGSATSNAATLTVLPTMALDKTSLVFSAASNGAAFTSATGTQAVRLTQTGAGTVTWTAASTKPWLTVSPASGTGSATLTVGTQFAAGLVASQTGAINLTFTGASNTAGPLAATLTTLPSGTTAAPFGSFDTPTDGTTGVTGSIAVTGWALDDVEVTGVRILRDPVAPEPAGTLVLIGDAVLVDGARPDVQALNPTAPRNTRAGWGYLMLTNFLPNLGNGTFRLTAIADDGDGHSTTLGTKTITCTNSTATAPTGAIDTPVQGGTVSGTVTNFGWVLSPSPRRADPPGGGTVQVVIDGAFIRAVPSGWTSRADLTALFPAAQFPGIATALGVAGFDSVALANGVHTISWVVTDNMGSASGIGSRYFTVSNGSLYLDPAQGVVTTSGSTMIGGPTSLSMPRAAAPGSDVDTAPGDVTTIRGRRGFSLDTPLQAYAFRDGRATVQAEELDRIELSLSDTPGQSYSGYLRVGDSLTPLPIGTALNAATGDFTWMPGVGFVGTYDLVFVRWSGGHAVARQDVRIVLNPQGSSRVGPQTVIDTPSSAVASAFRRKDPIVVAGWAADLDAESDRGVDTVHVWAYPATPSTGSGQAADPIWIGAATYGGARPDVAAVYGDRFLNTGYGITVQGLTPGTYDIAVFAYSTVTGGFTAAKTVRVTVR